MTGYKHKVQYYETDKMGITHHSNYIRWMEEARVDFLSRIGWPYERLEEVGLSSPVTETHVRYLHPTTFGDEVEIELSVSELKLTKMSVRYSMRKGDGTVVAEAESVHGFFKEDGKPSILKRDYPGLYEALEKNVIKDFE